LGYYVFGIPAALMVNLYYDYGVYGTWVVLSISATIETIYFIF